MPQPRTSTTNRLLGYPDDARLLIINADDFGMCHATNAAIIRTLTEGIVRTTTLMVPCSWSLHAMRLLRENSDFDFGVHLTAIGDGYDYRWGPLTPRDRVPSLVDETGYFYNFDRMAEFFARARMDELEVEFRAQIEAVLAAGLKPTHLDWHSLRIDARTDIPGVILGLAKEYGLALRVRGRAFIEKVQSQGLPCNDYDFMDSSMLDTTDKPALLARMLHELPAGLSEWAVHPGLDTPELLAVEPGDIRFRQTDYDAMLSPEVREVIRREDIVLLSYAALQPLWQAR